MTALTRRAVLAGASAAALAPLGVSSARAVAPPSGRQAPGIYRYKVGAYECTSINDGSRTFPMPDAFVTNVGKDEALKAAAAAYFPKGSVTVPFNPQLINTGSKLILIDTGYGPGIAPSVGLTVTNMLAAGIDPKAVDMVILSHLHPDHANGIRMADGSLAFPNAEIKLPAKDWAFWMSDDNMSKAQGDLMKNYFGNVRKVFAGLENKVTRYEWDQEVAPGVTALSTPGHTPGHTSFAVASGNARIFIQSDVTNIPEFFLLHPDWHVMYDVDPVQAQATRHRFYDMASAEKATVVGFHFSFPSVGHVEKNGQGYRLIPATWQPVL